MIKNIPRIIGFNNRSRFDLSINLSDCDSDLKSNKHTTTSRHSWSVLMQVNLLFVYIDEDPIT